MGIKDIHPSYAKVTFRPGICHVCRGAPSDLVYCSEMYKNKFIVRYGPYVAKTAIEKDISRKEAEDELRDKRKAEFCQRNRVELVYFRYDKEISKRMVIQRLKKCT